MFGRNKEDNQVEKPVEYKAEYIIGHKAYPKKQHTKVLVYNDRIELTELNLTIPMNQITDIANEDEKRIRKRRILLVGVLALFWKKNFVYTVIEYNDGVDSQTIVIDFDKNIDKAQLHIYNRMLAARIPKPKPTYEETHVPTKSGTGSPLP